jgi:hypothetical protein
MRFLNPHSRLVLYWFLLGHMTSTVAAASAQVAYYVSPLGNDWNPGTELQPFKTLEKARDAVRTLNGRMMNDITIYLRGGEYQLCMPVVFDQRDSGTNRFTVIYRAYPGERPVVTGGQRITGWKATTNGLYKASVRTAQPAPCTPSDNSRPNQLQFRQLYVNGHRAVRARTPNTGEYYRLKSWDTLNRRVEINRSEISDWERLNQVEMIILGKGANQGNLRIASFSPAGTSAFVVPLEPERTRMFAQEYPPKESRPYYFENAIEFLDAPGEWYLDATTQELFYKPRPGEDLTSAVVVAPRVETLVRIQSTLDAPAHHIQFHGLTFEHTIWLLPNSEGFIGDQASIAFTQRLPTDQVTSYPGDRLPAAFHLESASNIRLERNTFQHLGGSAINLYAAAQDNALIGNVITDVSGSGISLDLNLEGNPTDARKVSRRNFISNNYITGIGRDYYQSVGIMAGYTDTTVIEHNELTDMPYSAISVGWGWADVPNAARNNVVSYNKISNVLNMMADGGGIYTLSRQPGTQIVGNHIYDLRRPPTAGGFTNGGIFLDDGSNLITVQDNVLHNVEDMNVKLNNTGTGNVIRNNDVLSLQVLTNAGLEPGYRDIRPPETGAVSPRSGRHPSAMRSAALAASLTLLTLLAYVGYRVHHRHCWV